MNALSDSGKTTLLNVLSTDAVSQAFQTRNIQVSFECFDTLFLVEPYDNLVYRLLKELLANIYKHSDGSGAWITLTLKDEVIDLYVADNGTTDTNCLLLADRTNHKGIASIQEQIRGMSGVMDISKRASHGICIRLTGTLQTQTPAHSVD